MCCPPGSTSTTAASDAHPASDPLPGVTGYRTPRSSDMIRRSPGRGGPPQFPPPPSIRSAPHTPGSPSRLRFQALRRFHGLHPDFGGLGTLCPCSKTGPLTTSQASHNVTDRIAAPLKGLSTGLRPGRFQAKPPACYRPLGSYPDRTSTSRRRRAYEHKDAPWRYVTVSPPRSAGHTNSQG